MSKSLQIISSISSGKKNKRIRNTSTNNPMVNSIFVLFFCVVFFCCLNNDGNKMKIKQKHKNSSNRYAPKPSIKFCNVWWIQRFCSEGAMGYTGIILARDYDIVHSSSSLAKGFFPEAHIQVRNKIRIDQGIAIATIWPKYSSEMK